MGDPTTNTLPRQIDRFQVRRVLGRGAQGVVLLAFDPKLEREVAIKTLARTLSARSGAEELLKEARLAARLQHPNIVRVFDCGASAGLPYVVFEYVEGVSLQEISTAEGPMTPNRAIEIVTPILEAIHYAHEQGVVHRDLKPANILIDARGVPRIADFGIAGLLGQKAPGEMTGSAGYMPPEQLESHPLRRELDIFAVGVVLYQLVAGRLPIQADNLFAQLFQMSHEEIPPPSQVRKEIDGAVDALILRALEKEPDRRYADAAEFLAALRVYQERGREEGEAAASAGSGTLEFLLRRMRHKPNFPAMSQHVAEINRMSADGSDWSANVLANLVLNDYSLTTKLLRLVNSPLFGQYGREISTISRAIVILGFKQVRLAALSLLLFEHLQGGDSADELRDAAVGALMSGLMAHRLAGKLRLEEPEEAYVCAMFHGLGRHLVIYYFPEEYRVIQERMAHRNDNEQSAARTVLGVSYADIGVGVARSWGFPPTLRASIAALPSGKLPRAGTREAKLHQLAGISNEVCRAFTTQRGDARNQALAGIRERFGDTLALDDKALFSLVETTLEEIREHAEMMRLPTGGSSLLRQVREWRSEQLGAVDEVEESGSPLEEVPAGQHPQADVTATLMAGVQEITNAMLEECPLNELLTMVLEVIYRGLQPTRVLFWVRDPKHRQMVTRFGFGKDIDHLLGQLRFSLGEGEDLFNRALREGTDVAVADTQESKVAAQIPEWCRTRLSARTLLLYPLMIKQAPLGLILVDWEEPHRVPAAAMERLLKTLRNQAVLAVRQQGSR